MTTDALIEALETRGITLVAEGAFLRYRPKSALTETDLAALRALKAEILATLAKRQPPPRIARVTCYSCRGHRFWISAYGVTVCTTCHPPAAPVFVASWIEVE